MTLDELKTLCARKSGCKGFTYLIMNDSKGNKRTMYNLVKEKPIAFKDPSVSFTQNSKCYTTESISKDSKSNRGEEIDKLLWDTSM
jgi:hypothetical protein